MRKKVISLSCVAIAAALIGVFAYQNTTNNGNRNSLLLKQNVEALSQDEGMGNRIKCYSSLVYEAGASVVDCSDCTSKENKTDAWYSFHDYCFTN